jgi:hypothetical protein
MFDMTKRRPIEIRVIDRREEGGVSEEDAAASNGVSADALVLMRLLLDSDQVSMSFSAIEGSTGNELSFEPLFNFWLGLTSHLARRETTEEGQEHLRKFLERVLNLMRMSVELSRLPGDMPSA